jgi:hypothetical protein
MFRRITAVALCALSSQAFAWGMFAGTVEVMHVNTYGNYADSYLDQGFCFKLKGSSHYLKIAFAETGEKRANHDFVKTLVLAAYMSGKELKAYYVNWGTDPLCRVNGANLPAKWLEDLQMAN